MSPTPTKSDSSGVTFSADMRMMRLLDIKEYENMPVNKWGFASQEKFTIKEEIEEKMVSPLSFSGIFSSLNDRN